MVDPPSIPDRAERPRARRRVADAANRIVRVLAVSAERYFADRCPLHAAGIAYRVLFSSVPLAIVLVSVFDLILGNKAVHDAVVDTIVSALPSSAAHRTDVAGEITTIATPPGLVGLVTLGRSEEHTSE